MILNILSLLTRNFYYIVTKTTVENYLMNDGFDYCNLGKKKIN